MTSKPDRKTCEQVLLIEDDAQDVRLIREAMQLSGFETNLVVLGTGREALAYLRNVGAADGPPRPDLILIDLSLPIPGPDGRDVLAELKGLPPVRKVPVLILTDSSDPGDLNVCYQLGANAFLTKPKDLLGYADLMSRIESFWCGDAIARA